jgi:hypothetical protein
VSNQPNNPFYDDKPIEQQHVSARVPERVARGVLTTGQLILDSPKEIVIDFLQGLTRPFQVGSRVVVAPQTMVEFISALQQNLDNYTKQFGPPPPQTQPPTQNTKTNQ